MALPDGQLEWLETNPLGSFGLCCVDRKLRRKYHALLTVRDPGRGDAWNLLAEVRERIETAGHSVLLADPLGAEGDAGALVDFRAYPHACHQYRPALAGVAREPVIEREVRLGARDQVELRYSFRNVRSKLRVSLEPLLRCRPLHELTHENPFLDGACVKLGDEVRMLPYAGMPALAFRVFGADARLEEHGSWLDVFYEWEAARGYAASESLFAPARWLIELDADASFTFVVGMHRVETPVSGGAPERPQRPELDARAISELAARAGDNPSFAAKLASAAERFSIVCSRAEPRASTRAATPGPAALVQAVVAGFPWFGVWSRDALIALPGLYLASGDFARAEGVLEALAGARVGGLIPNLPALGSTPADTASVDASLLFARAVQWFAQHVGAPHVERFMPVVCELLESLADGDDPRMRFDHGVGVRLAPGQHALTWMDAQINGVPVTPRNGYAVDIDALAYNAAHFACAWADTHRPRFARTFRTRLRGAEAEFAARYWDDARGYLADGHDGRHPDPSLRPNQLWALGLPFRPVTGGVARAALEAVQRTLLVPVGLRTLAPHDPAYRGHYGGSQAERDRAYHQGSAWPWLMGIYADAVLQELGREALEEQLGPLLSRMVRHIDDEGCIGQISELFDGDAPHAPGGAPAQAWSVAEVYRAFHMLHETTVSSSRADLRASIPSSRADPRASTPSSRADPRALTAQPSSPPPGLDAAALQHDEKASL
jgi:predicted glycogen debranching enzyme